MYFNGEKMMTTRPARPLTEDNRPMLKMKQLTDATGVAKSTILLYVKKGLLPRPVKTCPNMAYYHPDCINRIAFIKQVQNSHHLPLEAIKGLLREMDRGRDVGSFLALQSLLFGSDTERMNRSAFCRATGLSDGELSRLCRENLILPMGPDSFDGQDVVIGVLLKRGMDLGIETADLAFYPVAANRIVEAEIRLRERYTKNLDFSENASLTMELTRVAKGLRTYIIDRILQKKLIRYNGLNPRTEDKN